LISWFRVNNIHDPKFNHKNKMLVLWELLFLMD
jgi:hypothetical protein